MSRDADPDFHAIMVFAIKAKKQMLAANDRAASKSCPFCKAGRWHFRLLGPRNHLHGGCDNCTCRVME